MRLEDQDQNIEQQQDENQDSLHKPSKFMLYMGSLLSGSILSGQEARKVYPYLLLVAFLSWLYISNGYQMQQLYREQAQLKAEIKQLRSKSVTISSTMMNATRQSVIKKELSSRGIDVSESTTPHKVIE